MGIGLLLVEVVFARPTSMTEAAAARSRSTFL
jgi:hypothetical protein